MVLYYVLQKGPLNKILGMDEGTSCVAHMVGNFDFGGWSERVRNNVGEFREHNLDSNGTIFYRPISIEKNSIVTVNFHHRDTIFIDWIVQLGPIRYNFARSCNSDCM